MFHLADRGKMGHGKDNQNEQFAENKRENLRTRNTPDFVAINIHPADTLRPSNNHNASLYINILLLAFQFCSIQSLLTLRKNNKE